jgi:hypothetical protein
MERTMTDQELFSPETIALNRRIQEEDDPQKREEMMLELAEKALQVHDKSDLDLDDEVHALFDDLELAKVHYRQAALRVARVVSHTLLVIEDAETSPPGSPLN